MSALGASVGRVNGADYRRLLRAAMPLVSLAVILGMSEHDQHTYCARSPEVGSFVSGAHVRAFGCRPNRVLVRERPEDVEVGSDDGDVRLLGCARQLKHLRLPLVTEVSRVRAGLGEDVRE